MYQTCHKSIILPCRKTIFLYVRMQWLSIFAFHRNKFLFIIIRARNRWRYIRLNVYLTFREWFYVLLKKPSSTHKPQECSAMSVNVSIIEKKKKDKRKKSAFDRSSYGLAGRWFNSAKLRKTSVSVNPEVFVLPAVKSG